MSKTQKYMLEIILFSTYALFAMSWKAGDFLIANYGFNTSQLALMTNAISAAKIIGCIMASGIIAKFGVKNVYTLATLLTILGALLPFTTNFSLIFIIRFILGLGGALVLVAINPIVAEIFNTEELTTINGINSVAFNFGLAIILALATPIKASPTLSIILISVAIIATLFCWLLLSKYVSRNTQSINTNNNETYSLKDGLKDKFNWIFSLSYAGLLSFYLVAFTFMKADNIKYVIFAGIIGALVGSFWGKKFSNQLRLVRICGLIQLLSAVLFLLYYEHELAVRFIGIILGFFIFLPMPAFVTLAYKRPNLTSKKISVTFSIFWSVSYFSSIIILQIFAWLKDLNGSNTIPFIFIIAIETSFFIGTTFFLKRKDKILSIH